MTIYLFHNVHGESDLLTQTATQFTEVQCVPYGWADEVVAARERLIAELGIAVPALPAVAFFVPEVIIIDADKRYVIDAHWECRTLFEVGNTSDWEDISAWINAFVSARVAGEPTPPVLVGE